MNNTISERGVAFAKKRPLFFDVLSNLWHPESNPDGIVNLGLAENSLLHRELTDFINSQRLASPHTLTYGDGFSGSKLLQETLCRFLNRHFRPRVALEPTGMLITSGVSNAVECCAWSLFEPGDYVMVGRPYWTTFQHLFGTRAGVKVLEVSFDSVDPFGEDAAEIYDKACIQAGEEGKRIRGLLLCSPNNPLGKCYPRNVLESLMKLQGYLGIFAHLACKDLGATGLRIGCLISQHNSAFLASAEGISLFNFPSSLADSTTSALLTSDEYVDSLVALNRRRLAESYRYITEFLQSHKIPFRESNAALFVWVNLGAVARGSNLSDDEILERLHAEKIYITSGRTYASEQPGWFRLVFAHSPEVLAEGLRRMIRSLA
ncbi:hypothetical protein AnigIFM63604_011055 [Aspergillus niger]|uniref:Aminotransferase class I/classII large domain-containing protein n=1 Tax=Aspergillus niger TaxID=5061 RepID=A0A9W6ED41_ASPNG|nr:hypothetical protein AnigIFM63604_011055 [Aspergillus niger]